jgi:hypothetical protein
MEKIAGNSRSGSGELQEVSCLDPYENHTRSWQLQCEYGHYCTGGVKYQCPAGRYGNAFGLHNKNCSGVCEAGYFCPPNSNKSQAIECGDPLGVVLPNFGAASRYMQDTWEGRGIHDTPSHRFGQQTIDKLDVRIENLHIVSPDQMYGSVYQGISHDIGINHHRNRSSHDPSAVYCPEGSQLPQPVEAGYYSIGGDNNTNKTRISQKQCEPGFYCESGKKFRCPKGRYGDTSGLASERCSGWCAAGHRCPFGTAQKDQYPCLDGEYAAKGYFKCSKCPSPPGTHTKFSCKTSRLCCGTYSH